MAIDLKRVSKTISHALRHEPWLYELELDEEGWVSVEALLSSLREENKAWVNLSVEGLHQMIAESSKKRHEIKGEKIRALYGHSTEHKLIKQIAEPPEILYHGTVANVADVILKEGLKPMGRQYVHLSVDVDTAKQVAQRKSKDIKILKINAKEVFNSGVKFYIGNEHVWLVDYIPSDFLLKMKLN